MIGYKVWSGGSQELTNCALIILALYNDFIRKNWISVCRMLKTISVKWFLKKPTITQDLAIVAVLEFPIGRLHNEFSHRPWCSWKGTKPGPDACKILLILWDSSVSAFLKNFY